MHLKYLELFCNEPILINVLGIHSPLQFLVWFSPPPPYSRGTDSPRWALPSWGTCCWRRAPPPPPPPEDSASERGGQTCPEIDPLVFPTSEDKLINYLCRDDHNHLVVILALSFALVRLYFQGYHGLHFGSLVAISWGTLLLLVFFKVKTKQSAKLCLKVGLSGKVRIIKSQIWDIWDYVYNACAHWNHWGCALSLAL